jgi:predicted methyltransferase
MAVGRLACTLWLYPMSSNVRGKRLQVAVRTPIRLRTRGHFEQFMVYCFDPDNLVIGVTPLAGDFPHVLAGPRYSPHGQIATYDATELIPDALEPYPDRRGCEREESCAEVVNRSISRGCLAVA